MTQLTDNIFCVDVPDDMEAFKTECIPEIDFYELNCYKLGEYDEPVKQHDIDLPPGTWTFLFTTRGATEEQMRQIVGSSEWYFPVQHIRYVDYAYPYDTQNKQAWSVGFAKAAESMNSLLRSKGCNTERNYAIVKLNEDE